MNAAYLRAVAFLVLSFACAACGKNDKPVPITASHVAPDAPKPPLITSSKDAAVAEQQSANEAIRDADLDAAMTVVLAKQLGGRKAMEEACKESQRDTPVEVEDTVFGDLDGDGYEEAAATAFSCQAGQSAPDLLAVFKQLKSGELVELPLQKVSDGQKINGKDQPKNLRGPWRIEIDKGRLIVRYLFWDADADSPKCDGADCTSDFVYRWDGKQLALVDIALSPVK